MIVSANSYHFESQASKELEFTSLTWWHHDMEPLKLRQAEETKTVSICILWRPGDGETLGFGSEKHAFTNMCQPWLGVVAHIYTWNTWELRRDKSQSQHELHRRILLKRKGRKRGRKNQIQSQKVESKENTRRDEDSQWLTDWLS